LVALGAVDPTVVAGDTSVDGWKVLCTTPEHHVIKQA